jgi:hypothetical protein
VRPAAWGWPLVTAATAGLAAALSAWVVERSHHAGDVRGVERPVEPPSPAAQPSDEELQALRWLVVGGGPTPELDEVGIEEDVALAAKVLGPGGRILFAGGPGAVDVRVQAAGSGGTSLRDELGELLAPRAGRGSTYRRSRLPVAAAATVEEAEATLEAALGEGDTPLWLVLAGHGNAAAEPRDNTFELWGGGALTATSLTELVDGTGTSRPLLVIATTCFGGGFAELVFGGADPGRGKPVTRRCGLFATSADLPASGCDPDPDRARHESYSLHFWHALAGQDATGHPLPLAELDLDGDGVVSPLEAHTRARLFGADVDVPTTTSERWLRAKAPHAGPRGAVSLPEEDALIRGLVRRTGLPEDLRRLRAVRAALDEAGRAARAEADERRGDEDDAFAALSGALLARWPVLDDPWHPAFEPILARDHDAISRFVATAPEVAAYRHAAAEATRADDAYWAVIRRAAPVTRLLRALETKELAARLAAQGGDDWETYQALLACERRRP